jgi:molybdopterin molybdotransferase
MELEVMLSVEDARERIHQSLSAVGLEAVRAVDAFGRVLAEALNASRTQPPFATSAMDGYAVRTADLTSLPTDLNIVGRVAAGARFEGPLGPREAVAIFTGARLPDGADAVVASEDAALEGSVVVIHDVPGRVAPGRHVRRIGTDFAKGDTLLPAGRRLTPRDLGLVAAMNCPDLVVYRRPRIAVLCTGNELRRPGARLGDDQIVDACGDAVAAVIAAAGGTVLSLGIARDNVDEVMDRLTAAGDVDLLVTIGGVSVGEFDVVLESLTRLGLSLGFHKVALRPGKPALWGTLGGMGVLGLPGNPVSALICVMLFLTPAIEALQGQPASELPIEAAAAGQDQWPNGPYYSFKHARLDPQPLRLPIATLSACQDTSVLSHFARAECLIVRPPLDPAVAKGEPVRIIRLHPIRSVL